MNRIKSFNIIEIIKWFLNYNENERVKFSFIFFFIIYYTRTFILVYKNNKW